MYYKQYGNTDMKVSAIGLGTMRYDEEDIAAGRLEKCAEIPLYAFEKGINSGIPHHFIVMIKVRL